MNRTIANSIIVAITKQREIKMYSPSLLNSDFIGLSSCIEMKDISVLFILGISIWLGSENSEYELNELNLDD